MTVVDYAALPAFPMRPGIAGKWIAGHDHGGSALSVLSNTVEPGVAVPLHYHGYEEIALVQSGRIWVELDGIRSSAGPGQCVTFPPGKPHAWGVEGDEPVEVLFIWPVLEPFAPGKSTYLEGAPPSVG